MQGNVVDLAVAVVLGTAFGAVVNALVENVLMPLIASLVGEPNFDSLFAISLLGGPPLQFGVLLSAVVNFLLIAAAIYFVVIMPMNKLIEARHRRFGAPAEEVEEDILLLQEIRDQLKAQTERINPDAIAAAAAAQQKADEAARAAEEARSAAATGLRGRARNILWGRD